MGKITSNRLSSATASTLLMVLAALLLTACGGSSKGSTSAGAKKTASGTASQPGARAAALRTCLQKAGITLPERKPGQGGTPGAGGPLGGGAPGEATKLPNGVSRAQLQAALKKCGGGQFPQGGKGFAAAGAERFAKFAACMRKNGVKLPQPDTSGKGPIFNTKGIDTKSAAFKAANAKCARELGPSGTRPGATAGSGSEAAPPGAPQGEAPAGAPPGQ